MASIGQSDAAAVRASGAAMRACADRRCAWQAVVTERRVPQRVRQGLNLESGLRDWGAWAPVIESFELADAAAETTTRLRQLLGPRINRATTSTRDDLQRSDLREHGLVLLPCFPD
jgi:hypothetical protein